MSLSVIGELTLSDEGAAVALWDAAGRWLAARGCVKIQFMVRTGNSAAHGFYEHIGYPVSDVVTRGRRLD